MKRTSLTRCVLDVLSPMEIVSFPSTYVTALCKYQTLETVVSDARVPPLNESQWLRPEAAWQCYWIELFQTKTVFLI